MPDPATPEGQTPADAQAAADPRSPEYFPAPPAEEGSAGSRRFVKRNVGSRTLLYVPSPAEILQRRVTPDGSPSDGDPTPLHRPTAPMVPVTPAGHGAPGPAGGPVVTVSRQVVSATVTVTRPGGETATTALAPSYSPPSPAAGLGAPRELAIPPLPPPKVEVTKHTLRSRLDPRLVLISKPDSPQAASFRSLRQRVVERGDPRSILVTSAEDGEGRSTCAANLALALAEVRRFKVLLVEADLRRPSLAEMFGAEPTGGSILEQARQTSTSDDEAVFHVTEIEGRGLHVALLDPKAGEERLDGPSFRTAVERLRRAYDYVVIDAPSVLAGPDVNLIEDSAQAILLAARARTSRGAALRSAIEQIAPANLLGVVLLDG